MAKNAKKEVKCSYCGSPVKRSGAYATMVVYVCTNPKCRRKTNVMVHLDPKEKK